MKKTLTLILLALIGGLCLTACSDDKDEPVSATTLPEAARTFIAQYFGGDKILKVEKDIDNGQTTFDVRFTSGYEVEFDQTGLWLDVDAPNGKTIPDGIAPQPIVEYASQNYPGDGINEISRTTTGFEAELVSGIDLHFDTEGNFIKVS